MTASAPQSRPSQPAGWMPVERRWLAALLAAMLPARRDWPGLGELELAPFWETFSKSAPLTLRFGLRTTVWVLGLSPFFLLRRPRTVSGLSDEERDRLVALAASSRLSLLREVVMTLKLVACFAYFHDSDLEAKSRALGAPAP